MRKSAKILIFISFAILVLFFVPLLLYPIAASIFLGQLPRPEFIMYYMTFPFQFGGNRGWIIALALLGQFCIYGIIAHMLMGKDLKKGAEFTKGEMFLWIISYLPFAVPFIILLVVLAVVKFIDIMISLFTGGERNLSDIINFILESAGFKKKTKVSGDEQLTTVYSVYKDGHKRELILVATYQQDNWHASPYCNQHYNRFQDDLGNYWRSYDDNKNFIEEKNIPNNVGTYVG